MEPQKPKPGYHSPPTKKPLSIFSEDSRGYNLLRKYIPFDFIKQIADVSMAWFENEEATKSQVIFQKDSKYNDSRRRQHGLELIIGKSLYDQLLLLVNLAIQESYPQHKIQQAGKLLISLPGCGMQQLHMDFKEMDEPEDVQLPIFVGIMTSHVDMVTNQELFDRKYTRVYYDIGDLIIMHGNQMHRGCSYEHLNMRIYFYAVNQNLGDNNKNGQYSYKSAQDLPERHPSHS